MRRLDDVKRYIDENKKRPSHHDSKNKNIRQLGTWISNQMTKYKNRTQIMLNEAIYNKWTETINNPQYKKYFQSNEEHWNEQLEKVIEYIDENKKRPSHHDNKNKDIRQLGTWISNQTKNYKNKTHIMSNQIIYNKWTETVNNPHFEKYFKKCQ
jgi:hypothetical protein